VKFLLAGMKISEEGSLPTVTTESEILAGVTVRLGSSTRRTAAVVICTSLGGLRLINRCGA
jgi:hypothetical protein